MRRARARSGGPDRCPRAPRQRASTPPRPPARRPCRPRPRRAAERERTRPRYGAGDGPCPCGRHRSRRPSRLEPQIGLAHAHDVAGRETARAVDANAVHVRAVRRAEVLHPDAVAARLEAHVPRGRELVALEREVVLAAAADGDRRGVDLELIALVEHGALLHDELPARRRRGCVGHDRPHDEALLAGLHAHVARDRADDPPDEEVEKDEERDLEREEDLFETRAREDHSRSVEKVTSVEPMVKLSPGSSFARFTRLPFTSRPLVESRSTIQKLVPSCLSSAWRRETFASSIWMSHSRERPRSTLRLSTRRRCPSHERTAASRSSGRPSGAPSAAAGAGCL